MASGLYGITFLNALKNTLALDLDSDTIKIMLVTSSYTPDFGAHDFKADVTNEVSGTNYTAGGNTLSSLALTQTGGTIKFDAADTSWSSATITDARGAVIYDDSLTDDPLIAYIDFGANYSSSNGTFTIAFNAGGIFTIDLTP
tara:strand:- start:680 stop:1108 length:429 start_codon:yes stop_codon:yes gene_type:complete